MNLSDEILDDIDGAEESQGRDSKLTRWAESARKLEARIDELKVQVSDYVEQASQGVLVEHDCPAMFACAFVVADNAGKEPGQSWCPVCMEWHGDCSMKEVTP